MEKRKYKLFIKRFDEIEKNLTKLQKMISWFNEELDPIEEKLNDVIQKLKKELPGEEYIQRLEESNHNAFTYKYRYERLQYVQKVLEKTRDEFEYVVGPKEEDVETSKSKKNEKIKVFLAFGRDEKAKKDVEILMRRLDLDPIILQDKPSPGQTVIEKLEEHSDVKFAVVLLTPDDIGYLNKVKIKNEHRARQNVIFELGYFYGKLKREKVVTIVKGEIDKLSDIFGVVDISMDDPEWTLKTKRDLKKAGIEIDPDKFLE